MNSRNSVECQYVYPSDQVVGCLPQQLLFLIHAYSIQRCQGVRIPERVVVVVKSLWATTNASLGKRQ